MSNVQNTYVFLADVSVICWIYQVKALLKIKGAPVFKSQFVDAYLVVYKHQPQVLINTRDISAEKLSASASSPAARCSLCQQACMISICREEGLAKFGVAQLSISIFVKSLHENCDLSVAARDSKLPHRTEQLVRLHLALSFQVKDSKCVNQVEFHLHGELNLQRLRFSFKGKELAENGNKFCLGVSSQWFGFKTRSSH